jgi:hypothetical protein
VNAGEFEINVDYVSNDMRNSSLKKDDFSTPLSNKIPKKNKKKELPNPAMV